MKNIIIKTSLRYFISRMILISFVILISSSNIYSQKSIHNFSTKYFPDFASRVSSSYYLVNSALIDTNTPDAKIKLQGGILRSSEFVYGSDKVRDLYDFLGVSFNPEFDSIMSLNPDAFEQAQGVIPLNAVSFVGFLVTMGMAIKISIDLLSNTQLGESSVDATSLIVMGISTVVEVIAGAISESILNNAVHTFNKNKNKNDKESSGSAQSLSPFQSLINPHRYSPHFSFDIYRNINSVDGTGTFYFGLKYNF